MRTFLIAATLLTGCGKDRADVAFDIKDKATELGMRAGVTIVGRFNKVTVSGSRCDDLERFVRDIGGPPDCVMVECNGSPLVSYEGYWHGGGGYYPKCSK